MSLALVGCQGGGGSESGSNTSDGNSDTSETNNSDGSNTAGNDDGQETASNDSAPATLTWDAPDERLNGDSLAVGEIDQYVVSWGKDPDELTNTKEVPCGTCVDMEHTIEDLGDGTWYFTVQTRDTEGNLSPEADLVSKQI